MAKKLEKAVAYLVRSPSEIYESADGNISKIDLQNISRSHLVVAALPDKEFVFHQFEVQKELSSDQVAESVDINMFQDAGLNPMIEYQNAFSTRASKIDNRKKVVSALAISATAVTEALEEIKDKSGYVDKAVPFGSLPYALYNSDTLEPKKDVFVYLLRESLLISVFADGELVYTKTQEGGIKKLLEDYVSLSNDRMEYSDFLQLLLTMEVDTDDVDQRQITLSYLREALAASVMSVKNVILYASRVSGLGEIDRVFVGSREGIIPGLDALAQELFEIETHEYHFYTDFYTEEMGYSDQMAVLALLEAQNTLNGLRENPFNVTIFKRPEHFLKRESGKIILFVAASVLAVLLWPAFYKSQTWFYEYKTKELLAKLGQTRAEFEAVQALRNSLIGEREKLNKDLATSKSNFEDSMSLLKSIHNKKLVSKPKTTSLSYLYDEMVKASVFTRELNVVGFDANLSIFASKDSQITNLLEKLVAKEFDPELKIIQRHQNGSFEADLIVRLP